MFFEHHFKKNEINGACDVACMGKRRGAQIDGACDVACMGTGGVHRLTGHVACMGTGEVHRWADLRG